MSLTTRSRDALDKAIEAGARGLAVFEQAVEHLLTSNRHLDHVIEHSTVTIANEQGRQAAAIAQQKKNDTIIARIKSLTE